MYVYNTFTLLSGSLYSTNTSTNIIIINIHSVEYYFQWQLSQFSDSLEAGLYVACFLTEARDIPSIQNVRPALGHIWPLVQWMMWILPQHRSSRCLRLITQLSFLLSLQISAVVVPLYVFIVYARTILSFTVVLKQ